MKIYNWSTNDEFEHVLTALETELRAELTSDASCTRETLIESVIRREISWQRLDRTCKQIEKENLRLLSGMDFIRQMMSQEKSKPKQIVDAVKLWFDNPELAAVLKIADIATKKDRASSGGYAKQEKNDRSKELQRQRSYIYALYLKEKVDVDKHGGQARFAAKMQILIGEYAASAPAITKWLGQWRKGNNIPAST